MEERPVDKLARYVILAAGLLIVAGLCWFYSNIIVYILLAAVFSLLARPVMAFLGKLKIKGKGLPSWANAVISIILLISCILLVAVNIIPVVAHVFKDISLVDVENMFRRISLEEINDVIISVFPAVGSDFRIEMVLWDRLKDIVDVSAFSSLIGSVANFVVNFGVGIFAVVFISFFFIRDSRLFSKIISAMVPDRLEKTANEAIADIEMLLSRYFVGLVAEMTGVALINFFGLWLIARLGVNAAIGIAFMTGILNIIPYVGPLMGGVLGTIMGLVLKLFGPAASSDVNIMVFALILVAIFFATQLVDNFLFQPLIYSSSIKASPLEIFIVLLAAGHVGGMLGMLVAIPGYTVIRVVAGTFFRKHKMIRRLIPAENADKDIS